MSMTANATTMAYARLEITRSLRDTGFVVFGIGLPVLMYLLLTNVGGTRGVDGWRTVSMVGMAAYAALGAALSTGTGVAEDRSTGWLRQLSITPMRPGQVVLGRAITGSVVVLPAIVVVLAAGALANGVRLDAWQWVSVAVLLWLGALPFTLLGIGNGYRLSAQTTGVVNTALSLGLAVIGGLWFPVQMFPDWLATICEYTPAHLFAELGWSVADGNAPSALTLVLVLVWAAFCAWYAAFSYRQHAKAA
ncbi:ABC transporter permease [Streptomyces sp. NPDC057638]|uniref:ABC transporter permease n=1 Tax=Streptomyces sp. NPDC057638 TaxID=3346190 RepID=UPI0036881605